MNTDHESGAGKTGLVMENISSVGRGLGKANILQAEVELGRVVILLKLYTSQI